MKTLKWKSTCQTTVWVAIMVGACSFTSVHADDYDIIINTSGTMVSGGGMGFNGGTWYRYPGGYYVQWFANGAYDADRLGYYHRYTYITTPTKQKGVISYAVGYCYTTPEWDQSNLYAPPLPNSIQSTSDEYKYMPIVETHSNENIYIGSTSANEIPSIEPTDHGFIYDYNPAWFGVVIAGSNIDVHGHILVYCLNSEDDLPGDDDDDDDDDTTIITGVCCNVATGAYYTQTSNNCASPYVWLGEGSTSADCNPDYFRWDYGDAPASYKVYKTDGGASHYINTQMYLGLGLTPDRDGLPSAAANLDLNDDGVTFTSALVIGNTTIVNILASQYGVVNAWIDLNHDGDWADSEERRVTDYPVGPGNNSIAVAIPATALAGQTYARFRYSTQTGLNYYGQAADGEVEDYVVTLTTGSGGSGGGDPTPTTVWPAQSPKHTYVPRWTQSSDFTGTQGNRLRGWPEPSLYQGKPVVADDWIANKSDPITAFRWWGSFTNWTQSTPPDNRPEAFHIAIWSDPVQAGVPSTVIWETQVENWSWTFCGFTDDPDGTLSNLAVFEFGALLSQDTWFYPTPSLGDHYWLSIAAIHPSTDSDNLWGWLTRAHGHGSAAVRIYQVADSQSNQIGQWPPALGDLAVYPLSIEKPVNTQWDMSFEIMTKAEMGGDGTFVVSADMNGDGVVSIQDLEMLTALWMAAVE